MLDLIKYLREFLKDGKKFWLSLIVILQLLLGVLLVLSQGSAISSFIYTNK